MTETSISSVDSKQTTDVFGAIGASISRSQEMQAVENREQLKVVVGNSVKKAKEYFAEKESAQQKVEELTFKRHKGVNALRIDPEERALEEIESRLPSALVVPETEGSAGVFAKLEKDYNEDFIKVVLSPYIDGQAIERESRKFGISEHERDVIYEFDPITRETTRHGLYDFDEGDQVYSQVAQALIMCVASMDKIPDTQ